MKVVAITLVLLFLAGAVFADPVTDAIQAKVEETLAKLAVLTGRMGYLMIEPISPPDEMMDVLVQVHTLIYDIFISFDEWMTNIQRLVEE